MSCREDKFHFLEKIQALYNIFAAFLSSFANITYLCSRKTGSLSHRDGQFFYIPSSLKMVWRSWRFALSILLLSRDFK